MASVSGALLPGEDAALHERGSLFDVEAVAGVRDVEAAIAQRGGAVVVVKSGVALVDVEEVGGDGGVAAHDGVDVESGVCTVCAVAHIEVREVRRAARELKADAAPALAVAPDDIHFLRGGAVHIEHAEHADVVACGHADFHACLHGERDAGRNNEVVVKHVRRVRERESRVARECAADRGFRSGDESRGDARSAGDCRAGTCATGRAGPTAKRVSGRWLGF